jgi:uncharacterized protein YpiB (UPF0302 family)
MEKQYDLQVYVDDIVNRLNQMMENLPYDEEEQMFELDRVETEEAVLTFGQKVLLNDIDDSLDWSELDDRWDQLEMSAF